MCVKCCTRLTWAVCFKEGIYLAKKTVLAESVVPDHSDRTCSKRGFLRAKFIYHIFGSSSYDLCGILSGQQFNNTHHCPLEIAASSPDFPCACPFDAGNYHLNPTTFQIPELSGLLKWLASV
ncbi:hypothetical protein DPMN_041560 [Dreissena polymorpha]|uniref:Uncharacterized protein n=1 Tax=Dreissena polymorpha TaxID=45954 RepID=A0A9D4HW71_DREPO|nr:hypothetical protein DPMN_041560 [Dreissena polymorpha]